MKNTTKKMSNKDYFYLAKCSLKARKKSTRTTVRGIAFGLILILPVLFFTFAYYIDFTSQVNKVESVSMLNITTMHKDYIEPTQKNSGNGFILANNIINTLDERVKPKESIIFERYGASASAMRASINGGELQEFFVDNNMNYSYKPEPKAQFNELSFLHYDASGGRLVSASTLKELNLETPIIEGKDFTAATKGKSEILISQAFATANKLKVGNEISLSFVGRDSGEQNGNIFIDDDNIVGNSYERIYDNNTTTIEQEIMSGFTVVGIIDDKVYLHANGNHMSNFIMTDASLYNSGKAYSPILRRVTEESETYNSSYSLVTYASDMPTLADDATSNGYFALTLGYGISHVDGSASEVMLYQQQYASYADCDAAGKIIVNTLKALDIETYNEVPFTTSVFGSLQMISKISTIVIAVFLVFGGVILLATLINLYNSIQYSVEARRNYMGMLRAIGTKDKSIYRMYFTEILRIFLRALVWIGIIGGGISIGVKFGLDSLFNYAGDFFPIKLTLNLWYLPAVLGGLMLFALGISWLYSRISCRSLAKKPILSLLKEDR